MLSDVQISIVK